MSVMISIKPKRCELIANGWHISDLVIYDKPKASVAEYFAGDEKLKGILCKRKE